MDHQLDVLQPPRQVGQVLRRWHHPVAPAVGDEHRLVAARAVGPTATSLHQRQRAAREGPAPQVTTQVGTPAPSPVPDASVDSAQCAYVLHELAETTAVAVAETYRMLRPGARVAIADHRKASGIAHNREIEAWYARRPGGASLDERHPTSSLEGPEEVRAADSATHSSRAVLLMPGSPHSTSGARRPGEHRQGSGQGLPAPGAVRTGPFTQKLNGLRSPRATAGNPSFNDTRSHVTDTVTDPLSSHPP
ncbi:methyltransferase domain-containing protein [Streptomyces sp. NPDC050549]|uniref:class I SAM-dependent methyltransferase n=1 Tax=Streptomyces sp. NPDC050549 TaxID=3155406 RepID=UPI00342DD922